MFHFEALPAGPASRQNWYQELLDHPGCQNELIKIREAYLSQRTAGLTKSIETLQTWLLSASEDARGTFFKTDEVLVAHLARLKAFPQEDRVTMYRDQQINCCCIWTRPPEAIQNQILAIQDRLRSLGSSDIYLVPREDLHLGVLELSHRHEIDHLSSVCEEVGQSRLHDMLDFPAQAMASSGLKAVLDSPQLVFDRMGIALNFLPAAGANVHDGIPDLSVPFSYHHIRNELHKIALSSGIAIDMCYTAATAHITLARFVGSNFMNTKEKGETFLGLVDEINKLLKDASSSDKDPWIVGEKGGLELQKGYLKFGLNSQDAIARGHGFANLQPRTIAQ